jgi:hypothetical protein
MIKRMIKICTMTSTVLEVERPSERAGTRWFVWCSIHRAPEHPGLPERAQYARRMTVQDLLAALQRLSRDAELLAFEPGCAVYCEREVDEVEWQGGRVYLHLGTRRDDPPRR